MKLQPIVRDINIDDSSVDEHSDVTIDAHHEDSDRSSVGHIEDVAIDITIVETHPTSSSADSEATLHGSEDEDELCDVVDVVYLDDGEEGMVEEVVVSIADDAIYEAPEVMEAILPEVFEVDVEFERGMDVDMVVVEVEVEVGVKKPRKVDYGDGLTDAGSPWIGGRTDGPTVEMTCIRSRVKRVR